MQKRRILTLAAAPILAGSVAAAPAALAEGDSEGSTAPTVQDVQDLNGDGLGSLGETVETVTDALPLGGDTLGGLGGLGGGTVGIS